MKLIILSISIILLIFSTPYLYIKLKHEYWSKQPVSHYYNILLKKGQISDKIPDKIVSQKLIVNNFDYKNDILMNQWIQLLRNSYIPVNNSSISYSIDKSFLTWSLNIYFKNFILLAITDEQKLVGTITSRKMNIQINDDKLSFLYVDYLCIDSIYRKKGLAPILISNMAYEGFIRGQKLFIFKKEIYPLPYNYITSYMTYILSINTTENESKNVIEKENKSYFLLSKKSSKKEIYDCYSYYQEQSNKFKLYQNYTLEEFIYYFISSEHTYSYYIADDNTHIIGLIVLFDSQFQYNTKKSLELYLYLRNENDHIDIIYLILKSLNKYSYLYIPDIGYNEDILNTDTYQKDMCNMNYIHLYNYHEYKVNKKDVLLSFF